MKLSQTLRRERTNAALRAAQTFNAPGTFYPQFGKVSFRVGGRGGSGNPTSPGNYAGTNAATPGTIAYYNPTVPGNYAGTNPPGGGYFAGYNQTNGGNYAGTNPGTGGNSTYTPGNTVPGNSVPASYTPGNPVAGTNNPGSTVPGYYNPGNYEEYIAVGQNRCPGGWTQQGYHDGYNAGTQGAICVRGTPGNVNPPSYQPGYTNPSYTNPGTYTPAYANPPSSNPGVTTYYSYQPGFAYYNPVVPGNPVYNPTNPGNARYNPGNPGSAVYNPATGGSDYYNPPAPGNAAASYAISGVLFPGGAAGAVAPVVIPTPVLWSYTNQGYPVTVSPGGYVIITPT